jgi:hypothetical protein
MELKAAGFKGRYLAEYLAVRPAVGSKGQGSRTGCWVVWRDPWRSEVWTD